MDPRLVNYLREYADKYGLENLKIALKRKGYPDKEILDAEKAYLKDPEGKLGLPLEEPTTIKPKSKLNSKAKDSLVFGILSFFFGWIPLIGWALIVFAIVLGLKGLKEIKKNKEFKGKEYALWGLTLGTISIIIAIILVVQVILFVSTFGTLTPKGVEVVYDNEGIEMVIPSDPNYKEPTQGIIKSCRFQSGIDCTGYEKNEDSFTIGIENDFDRDVVISKLAIESSLGGACKWDGELEVLYGDQFNVVINCPSFKKQVGQFDITIDFWFGDSFPEFTKQITGEIILE